MTKLNKKSKKITNSKGNEKIVVKKVDKKKELTKKGNFKKKVNTCSPGESDMLVEDICVLDNGFTVQSYDSISNGNNDFEDNNDELVMNQSDNEVEANNDDEDDVKYVCKDENIYHKNALERLQEIDPEFYKYLAENDQKLLNFNLSEDESEGDDQVDDESKLHKSSDDLEIASDEADSESGDGENEIDSCVITLKMLKQWQNNIVEDKTNKTIGCLVHAFHAAMLQVSEHKEDAEDLRYKVDDPTVYNGVIQLCILELGPAVRRFLGLKNGSKRPPHKCSKFSKIKNLLKIYFIDLLKILSHVTSSSTLNAILKHLRYISPLAIPYPIVIKLLIKKLVYLWGTAEESVRAVAFLCILRITHNQQQNLLDPVLRSMFMTYLQTTNFVSFNNLSAINFMRRSLVEMYVLDQTMTYRHAYLFIRQLAINLRNAATVKKKETILAVYNWKYINNLRLWGNLLVATCNKSQLQPLIYPFVQICIGTINLIPMAQYFPLRFHVLQILTDLSRDSSVFIPVIPFILEVLSIYDFNRTHQNESIKPLNFTCLLRLTKTQISENTFKDTTIDAVYGALVEYLSTTSHSIAFPDLVLIVKIQLKNFLKTNNNASYKRKMSQLLDKIDSNIKFIENERYKVSFSLSDLKQIEAWEMIVKNKGTPLTMFYDSWNKLRIIKQSKELAENKEIVDHKLTLLESMESEEDRRDSITLEESEEKKGKLEKKGSGAAKKAKIEIDDKFNAIGDIIKILNNDYW